MNKCFSTVTCSVLLNRPQPEVVVYNFFLRKVVMQKCTDMISYCMQFEKIGRGLLPEAFQSERECFVSQKEKEK